MKHIRTVSLFCLLLGACLTNSTTPPHTNSIDDALLSQVSEVERGKLSEARQACDRAKDAYATAQGESRKRAEKLSRSCQDRSECTAKVVRAEAALASANEKGTSEEIETARQGVRSAQSDCDLQVVRSTLCNQQAVHAATVAEVAREHVRVTEARVELAKVRAVNTLDRPTAQKPEVGQYEASVRQAEGDEDVARAKSETAQREVEITTTMLRDRESGSPR